MRFSSSTKPVGFLFILRCFKTNAGAELKNKASALQPGIGAIDLPLGHTTVQCSRNSRLTLKRHNVLSRLFAIGNNILSLESFAYLLPIFLQTPAKTYNQIPDVFASVWTASLLAGNI
jgi:hypothetical protein